MPTKWMICAMLAATAASAAEPAATTAPTPAPIAEAEALASAAKAFYTRYKKLPDGGGIPDAKARKILTPAITPALDKLLADGDKAEAIYAKKTKNESPPLVEGDPFTSNFEGATSFKVGLCTGDAKRGSCKIELTYIDTTDKKKKAKPFTWTDTAEFAPVAAGWALDDIAYGGTWDFGNKGKLTDLLKEAIKESQENYDN